MAGANWTQYTGAVLPAINRLTEERGAWLCASISALGFQSVCFAVTTPVYLLGWVELVWATPLVTHLLFLAVLLYTFKAVGARSNAMVAWICFAGTISLLSFGLLLAASCGEWFGFLPQFVLAIVGASGGMLHNRMGPRDDTTGSIAAGYVTSSDISAKRGGNPDGLSSVRQTTSRWSATTAGSKCSL